MKYYSQKSIGARVIQADEAILNVQTNPDLNEAFVLQGYSEERLALGRELVDAAKAIDTLRRDQVGAQAVATSTASKAYRSLRLAFDADRRQFRLALLDAPDYVKALRLAENISPKRGDFVPQARHFYEKVKEHPEVLALVLAENNITPEYLDTRLQQIANLEEAFSVQRYLIGQTRQVQQQRREAMEELDAWMKRFIAVARIAFIDDQPKLAKLGIAVKTSRGDDEEEKKKAEGGESDSGGKGDGTSDSGGNGGGTSGSGGDGGSTSDSGGNSGDASESGGESIQGGAVVSSG